MKVVKFLRSHKMYQPGETAGFDAKTADGLIAAGFALDPNKKGEATQATADVLVNPVDLSQDSEVALQTRVQTSIEPASSGSQDPEPENAPAAEEASKDPEAKAAGRAKVSGKSDPKKG